MDDTQELNQGEGEKDAFEYKWREPFNPKAPI